MKLVKADKLTENALATALKSVIPIVSQNLNRFTYTDLLKNPDYIAYVITDNDNVHVGYVDGWWDRKNHKIDLFCWTNFVKETLHELGRKYHAIGIAKLNIIVDGDPVEELKEIGWTPEVRHKSYFLKGGESINAIQFGITDAELTNIFKTSK